MSPGVGATDKKEEKVSQAKRLAAFGKAIYILFPGTDGYRYAVLHDGPNIATRIDGDSFTDELRSSFYDEEDELPSDPALKSAVGILNEEARREPAQPVYLRIGESNNAIIVDLGDETGAFVIASAEGWELTDETTTSPVPFRRTTGMLALPAPVQREGEGDPLTYLRELVNLDEDHFRLAVAWMVAAFIPNIPHPALLLTGEQGTGKSEAAKRLRMLIDPRKGSQGRMPAEKDMGTALSSAWVYCLDNMSTITQAQSDALCRAVTGEGRTARKLYTDNDASVTDSRNVLIITTIGIPNLQSDLAERVVTLELEPIEAKKRRTEREINELFEKNSGVIFGALLDLLCDVLHQLPNVKVAELPRMADFAEILAAVDNARGWKTLDTYRQSLSVQIASGIESSPFMMAVLALVEQERKWRGTATKLLESVHRWDQQKEWPSSPQAVSVELRRWAPALRERGISWEQKRAPGTGDRKWFIDLMGSESEPAGQSEDSEGYVEPPF